jgi:hypothetical protein
MDIHSRRASRVFASLTVCWLPSNLPGLARARGQYGYVWNRSHAIAPDVQRLASEGVTRRNSRRTHPTAKARGRRGSTRSRGERGERPADCWWS